MEYIRCFWVSRYGHTRTRYLYDKIKEKTVNKTKAVALSAELSASAQDYAAIIMASHERTTDRGEPAKSCIETIKTLGVTQLRPMLLSSFIKFQPGQFSKLVERCVAWSVRFIVCGTPSGTIEGYYARIAVDIWNDKITKADQALSVIRPILPKDDEFRSSFENATESKAKIARYYLQAMQKAKDGTWPGNELTLEHVLDKDFDAQLHTASQEEHKAYLHRIGNLALIEADPNGKMQDMPFSKKRPILANKRNVSRCTREVADFQKWDVSEIDARQKTLADLAVKTWLIM